MIAIIALLGAISYPVIRSVQASSRVKGAKAKIESIRLALGNYASELGDYPPTSTGRGGNNVNEGNESLLRALRATQRLTHFEAKSEEVGNTDGDKLEELVDPWGNPFIYFHNADLASPGDKLSLYYFAGADGAGGPANRVKAKPRKDAKSGEYPGATTFVIWSAGPDGLNEDGSGDDIASW